MVLRTVHGSRTGESVEDLVSFVLALPDAPPVHETVVLTCAGHGEDRPTWTYVEADATSGIARRRCLQCGTAVGLLDSQERWTHPPMWSCSGCGHSIAELAAGLSVPDGTHVEWVVLACRCVECGRLAGLTDAVLDPAPLAEVLDRL